MIFSYSYPRAALTVDCCVFRDNHGTEEILLIQRDRPPFEGFWALPGGFIEMDETLMEAAMRELKEETGLKDIEMHQMHAFDKIDRDPRGRTISVVFTGQVMNADQKIRPASDARDVHWFTPDNIPLLAFDHNDIVRMAVRKRKLK